MVSIRAKMDKSASTPINEPSGLKREKRKEKKKKQQVVKGRLMEPDFDGTWYKYTRNKKEIRS